MTDQASRTTHFLTAADVAAMLGVTRKTVYAETQKDNIPHFKVGRQYRYHADAIERLGESPHKKAA